MLRLLCSFSFLLLVWSILDFLIFLYYYNRTSGDVHSNLIKSRHYRGMLKYDLIALVVCWVIVIVKVVIDYA